MLARAKEWSGTFKELAQKRDKIQRQIHHYMSDHKKLDTNDTRKDEREQRTEQAIATLNQVHDKIDRFLKAARPRKGKGKQNREVKSNRPPAKARSRAIMAWPPSIKKHQIIVDAQALGEGQEHHTL